MHDVTRSTPVGVLVKSKERHDGDLPGVKISGADLELEKVFGDHVHQNAVEHHLDGGIKRCTLANLYETSYKFTIDHCSQFGEKKNPIDAWLYR
jgi:hypothetical protein